MMAEYIEREKLPQKKERGFFLVDDFNAGWNACLNNIKSIPAADVVEVVRCKDCIQHVPVSCFCRMAGWTTRDEDFCSFAVKRRKADGT